MGTRADSYVCSYCGMTGPAPPDGTTISCGGGFLDVDHPANVEMVPRDVMPEVMGRAVSAALAAIDRPEATMEQSLQAALFELLGPGSREELVEVMGRAMGLASMGADAWEDSDYRAGWRLSASVALDALYSALVSEQVGRDA